MGIFPKEVLGLCFKKRKKPKKAEKKTLKKKKKGFFTKKIKGLFLNGGELPPEIFFMEWGEKKKKIPIPWGVGSFN